MKNQLFLLWVKTHHPKLLITLGLISLVSYILFTAFVVALVVSIWIGSGLAIKLGVTSLILSISCWILNWILVRYYEAKFKDLL